MKTVGQSLAKYGATCQVGDLVHFSGEIAVDPGSSAVVDRFDQVPLDGRALLGETGEPPVDIFQAPVLVQSWFVLDRFRQPHLPLKGR